MRLTSNESLGLYSILAIIIVGTVLVTFGVGPAFVLTPLMILLVVLWLGIQILRNVRILCLILKLSRLD